tara:strand:+ start:469 stop:759 length:291 start_codon:yes stop_codon:yes gene_type:complete
MSWAPVNVFLDHLSPVKGQEFEAWFDTHWIPHYHKCRDAAKHIYIIDISLASSDSLKSLETNLRKHADELGFDLDEFMEMAWVRAKKKFNDMNGDV